MDYIPEATELEDDFNAQAIAQCYCDVYAGEPWFQEFNQEKVQEWLESLHKDPNVLIKTVERDDRVVAFYFAKKGTFSNVLPLFEQTFPEIIKTPINGRSVDEKYLENEYVEGLGEKIRNTITSAIRDKEIEEGIPSKQKRTDEEIENTQILYMLDVGILKEYRSQGVNGEIYKAMFESILSSEWIIAQTLSKGPLKRLLEKYIGDKRIDIDFIPLEEKEEDSNEIQVRIGHDVFTFTTGYFPVIYKKEEKNNEQ